MVRFCFLSSVEIKRLMELLNEIKKTDVGIIYISHHLEEVFMIGDKITVLKDGKVVNKHLNKQLDQESLIKEMVGRPASLFYYRDKVEIKNKKRNLEIRNFNKSGLVNNVSFIAESGKIFGKKAFVNTLAGTKYRNITR